MSSQVRTSRKEASSTRPARQSSAGPAVAALQLGMRALARLSPGLAARAMDHLWFRAPRTRPQADAQACLATGRRSSVLVHGRRVVSWEWGEEGPCVLLMHGWGGHAGQLHAFVAPLLAAGMRVVAFDAPAHGVSGTSRHGGHRVTFFEFAAALQVLARQAAPLAGIVAHSGGCTAVALAMRQGWRAPERLVFVAPFCEPAAAIDGFAHQLGIAGEPVQRFRARVAQWLGVAWSGLDIADLPADLRRGPLLVLHDRGDREVPIAQSQRLVDAWPGARLVETAGSGHRRILLQAQAVEAGVAFLVAGGSPRATESDYWSDYLPADSRAELDLAYEATDRFWQRDVG